LNSKVTEINSWKKQVDIEVSYKETQPYLEKAFNNFQKKVHIDGFRKGKVPRQLIEKKYGDAIRADAADDIIQNFFRKAMEEHELNLVSQGIVKDMSFDQGKPFTFIIEVEVEPEIEVDNYSGFKVDKEITRVTDQDVSDAVEILRNQRAEMKTIDGKAEDGHFIEGDIQSLDASGVPIIGKKWEDRVFEIGAPPLGDVLQDQLLGAQKGEERKLTLKTPQQDVTSSSQAVPDEHFSFHVKSIQEKILPTANNAFAKSLGEFESLDDLRDNLRNRIETQRNEEADKNLNTRIADEIIRRNDFELPPSMINNTLNAMWEDYQKRPQHDIDEEKYREQNRPSVIWSLKWNLLWRKIAELEEIQVLNEEIDKEIEHLVQSSKQDGKKLKTWFKNPKHRQRLKDNLLESKVMKQIKENIKIKEVILKKPKNEESRIIT
jgi:trigger factor